MPDRSQSRAKRDDFPTDICQTYPDLATVIDVWQRLLEAILAGILGIVTAAAK